MNIKFGFLLHLTCFLVVCSCRGFYLFATFCRSFDSGKSSSNLPQQDTHSESTSALRLLLYGNRRFPSVGHLYLLEANFKNTTWLHPHFLRCHLLTAGKPDNLPPHCTSASPAQPQRKAPGTWTRRLQLGKTETSPLLL